jgi:hypothetical protein
VIPNEREGGNVAKEPKDESTMTPEELEAQNGEELPDREVMSLINPGIDGVPTPAFEPLPADVD